MKTLSFLLSSSKKSRSFESFSTSSISKSSMSMIRGGEDPTNSGPGWEEEEGVGNG